MPLTSPPPTSPRMNLHRLLSSALGSEMPQDSAELHGHMDLLMQADAENKRRNQKLYLILDIDETLVFSKRMKPGAEMRIEAPVGKQIMVHNQPFDMVLRPGLETFLQMMQKKFVIFLYTMGDDAYTHAVLDVIDPKRQLIRGGVCCWRPSESREYKDLRRVACDPSMAVVVDDSIDVWRDWLPNLCLTRRFVGDPMDDGLMLLCSQLTDLHTAFYAARGAASAPTVPAVLSELRGKLLEGCVVAFTGLVADQSEELLKVQPLCVLVRQYGAVVTLDVEDATHLVARKKEGWKSASKIRRALQRQETDMSIRVVWDHWLLDSICHLKRQAEANFAVRMDEEEHDASYVPGRLEAMAPASAPPAPAAEPQPTYRGLSADEGGGRLSEILGAVSKTQGHPQMRVQPAVGEVARHAATDSPGIALSPAAGALPLRKRPRDEEAVAAPRSSAANQRLSVADYLKSKQVPAAASRPAASR